MFISEFCRWDLKLAFTTFPFYLFFCAASLLVKQESSNFSFTRIWTQNSPWWSVSFWGWRQPLLIFQNTTDRTKLHLTFPQKATANAVGALIVRPSVPTGQLTDPKSCPPFTHCRSVGRAWQQEIWRCRSHLFAAWSNSMWIQGAWQQKRPYAVDGDPFTMVSLASLDLF